MFEAVDMDLATVFRVPRSHVRSSGLRPPVATRGGSLSFSNH